MALQPLLLHFLVKMVALEPHSQVVVVVVVVGAVPVVTAVRAGMLLVDAVVILAQLAHREQTILVN
jgi:hypothetical protein